MCNSTPLQDPSGGRPAPAFDDLVSEYQDRVVNTCFRFVHNVQDAEDVAQEVFLELYQSLDGFRGEAALSTWIYRIAVTRSLDFLRKINRKKRMGRLKRLIGLGDDDPDDPVADLPDPRDGPIRDLEDRERAAVLQEALAALPEPQRVAVVLNKYEGLTSSEVAKVMGKTVSSVESLIHRAKDQLKRRLERYYEENLDE